MFARGFVVHGFKIVQYFLLFGGKEKQVTSEGLACLVTFSKAVST